MKVSVSACFPFHGKTIQIVLKKNLDTLNTSSNEDALFTFGLREDKYCLQIFPYE